MTCFAAPEQYDILDESGEIVGYMRLRHGVLAIYRVRDGVTSRNAAFVREFPLTRSSDPAPVSEERALLTDFDGHVNADGIFEEYEHREAYFDVARRILS